MYLGGTSIRTMEAANIVCGLTGPSNHLRAQAIRLPGMEEVYVDHRPGGAPMAIEVDVMLQRLQCDFTLVGWTPEVDILLSAWQQGANQFWVYGAIRDRLQGTVSQAVASITGRLGRSVPNSFQRGGSDHFDYSIRGIISYKLTIAGQSVLDWDFFNNRFQTAQTPTSPN